MLEHIPAWLGNAMSGLRAGMDKLAIVQLGENFETLVNEPVYREIAWRTVKIAALVTVTDALIAFPIAFHLISLNRFISFPLF